MNLYKFMEKILLINKNVYSSTKKYADINNFMFFSINVNKCNDKRCIKKYEYKLLIGQ